MHRADIYQMKSVNICERNVQNYTMCSTVYIRFMNVINLTQHSVKKVFCKQEKDNDTEPAKKKQYLHHHQKAFNLSNLW